MSLSYLKPEQEKKDTKAQKPENIAALRDALLAVMGTGSVESIKDESHHPVSVVSVEKKDEVQSIHPPIKPHNPSFHSRPETLSEKVENKMNIQTHKQEQQPKADTAPVVEKTKKEEVAGELLQKIFDIE